MAETCCRYLDFFQLVQVVQDLVLLMVMVLPQLLHLLQEVTQLLPDRSSVVAVAPLSPAAHGRLGTRGGQLPQHAVDQLVVHLQNAAHEQHLRLWGGGGT